MGSIRRVRAVIVAWNSQDHLPRCLAAIAATAWDGDLEVVVVDNGSTDGTTDAWSRRYPGVELRETGANLGFAAAANRGLTDLDGVDAVALVNPDAFVEPGWLVPLANALEDDGRIGAACPKILFAEPGPRGEAIINNAGNELSSRWEPRDRGYGEPDRGQYDEPEDVWGWCGGAALLRREYLQDVGRFDERLFMYAEDADLSWRGARRGWRYRYVPASVVHHVRGASSGGERTPMLDYLNRRNRLVVVSRHGGVRGAVSAWTRAVGGLVVAAVAATGRSLLRRPADWGGVRRRAVAASHAARLLATGRVPASAPLPPAAAARP